MKINKRIEVVRTTNRKFISMGVKSSRRIVAALSQHYEYVGTSVINDLSDLERLVESRPDLVFLGLKRLPHEGDSRDESTDDIWISEYLDQNNIVYTGADMHAMKLEFNKEKAKARLRFANLPTARSFISAPGRHTYVQSLPLPFPLFIKPLNGGGGSGIDDNSVVHTFADFQHKVGSIHAKNDSSSLVEQYLEGREFSVAILDGYGLGNAKVMPIEIVTTENSRGDRILGSRVKTEDNELVITVNDRITRAAVSKLALDVYKTLGGRDLARIDIRMDNYGNLNFLEANFMPAPGSRYFAGAFALNEGTNYEEVMLNITELALSRNEQSDETQETTKINSEAFIARK